MNDQRRTAAALERWLGEDFAPDPQPAIDRALQQVATTNQRHRWWPLVPTGMRGHARGLLYGAVAVAAAIALLAFGVNGPLTSDTRPDEPAAAPGPKVIVLSPDGTGDAVSLSAAVDRARDGDIIRLRPGTYIDSVLVDKDITIEGAGPRGGVVVVASETLPASSGELADGAQLSQAPYAFAFVESAATIRGLTIQAPEVSRAVLVIGGEPTLDDLSIRLEGSFEGWEGGLSDPHTAIHFAAGAGGELRDSDIESGSVHLSDGASPLVANNDITCHMLVSGPGTNPAIESNTIGGDDCQWSVKVAFGAAPRIEGNDISIADAEALIVTERTYTFIGSIEAQDAASAPSSEGPTIIANRVHSSGTGVVLEGDAPVTLLDNDIESNRIGVTIRGGQPIVRDNDVRGNIVGVTVWSTSPSLTANRIEGNRTGLQMDAAANPDMIDNRICGNEDNLKIAGASIGSVDDTGCLAMPST